MLYSADLGLRRDQIGHSGSQVASATSNIKHIFGNFQLLSEILKSIGVHVWS